MLKNLINHGFLTEEECIADYSGEVKWRKHVTESNMHGQNALVNILKNLMYLCIYL